MKRFFCKTCKKVKRVRKLPTDIIKHGSDDYKEKMPHQRISECRKHKE